MLAKLLQNSKRAKKKLKNFNYEILYYLKSEILNWMLNIKREIKQSLSSFVLRGFLLCEKWPSLCVNELAESQYNGLVSSFRNLPYSQDCCKSDIIRRMLFIKFDLCSLSRMLPVDGYAESM